jgi:hypothetical protein
VEKAVTSPELTESIPSLNLALNDVRSLVKNLDGTIGPLSSDIMATLEDTRNLVRDFGRHAESLQESIDRASDATRKAMEQAEKTFGALEHRVRSGLSGDFSALPDPGRDIRNGRFDTRPVRLPQQTPRGHAAGQRRMRRKPRTMNMSRHLTVVLLCTAMLLLNGCASDRAHEVLPS